MNDDYRLLENIASFLKQGYLIEDILSLCQVIDKNAKIDLIHQFLKQGMSLDEAIIQSGFNRTFIEYFKFFRLEDNLADAIIKSLSIVSKINITANKIKKQLTYPIVLIAFLVGFSLFIVYGLLPSVNQLFIEFDISLGLITRLIFWSFKIIPIIIILLILLFSTAVIITIYAIKRQYFKLLDLLVSYCFLIKIIIQKYYSIKFALYYNELLINGYDFSNIITTLYQKIDDSDIKMLVYEIYLQVLKGQDLVMIISEFVYFEPLFVSFFKLLIHDTRQDKSLNNYLELSLETLNFQLKRIMKYVVVFVYCFTALFVIIVYISIIIPMMNVVGSL